MNPFRLEHLNFIPRNAEIKVYSSPGTGIRGWERVKMGESINWMRWGSKVDVTVK